MAASAAVANGSEVSCIPGLHTAASLEDFLNGRGRFIVIRTRKADGLEAWARLLRGGSGLGWGHSVKREMRDNGHVNIAGARAEAGEVSAGSRGDLWLRTWGRHSRVSGERVGV